MYTHYLKIRDKYILGIRKGLKKREYRLCEPKIRKINVGDIIVLTSKINPNNFAIVKVIGKTYYINWEDALKCTWKEDFIGLYSSFNDALKDCSNFYSKREVMQYGIVCFDIVFMF